MNYNNYKDKMYNLIMKSVFEDGIYSIIENVIDVIEDTNEISVINVQRATTLSNEKRFQGEAGTPDLLIVSEDFKYSYSDKEQGRVYGAIEAKAPSVKLDKKSQTNGHKKSYKKVIYTNGLVWDYYDEDDDKNNWRIVLAYTEQENEIESFNGKNEEFNRNYIRKEKFGELLFNLAKIDWKYER